MQASLEKLGMDADLAVHRARSASRTGRKRERSVAAPVDAEGDAEMVDAGQPPKKRVHSSKSRCGPVCCHDAQLPATVAAGLPASSCSTIVSRCSGVEAIILH